MTLLKGEVLKSLEVLKAIQPRATVFTSHFFYDETQTLCVIHRLLPLSYFIFSTFFFFLREYTFLMKIELDQNELCDAL